MASVFACLSRFRRGPIAVTRVVSDVSVLCPRLGAWQGTPHGLRLTAAHAEDVRLGEEGVPTEIEIVGGLAFHDGLLGERDRLVRSGQPCEGLCSRASPNGVWKDPVAGRVWHYLGQAGSLLEATLPAEYFGDARPREEAHPHHSRSASISPFATRRISSAAAKSSASISMLACLGDSAWALRRRSTARLTSCAPTELKAIAAAVFHKEGGGRRTARTP
jgi:hypothetical protein